MSLWANVPHYLSNTPNPKAMYALVRRVLGVLDHPLDLHDVETAVSDFESKVAEVIANNPAVASYVRQLEERESDEGEDTPRAGNPSYPAAINWSKSWSNSCGSNAATSRLNESGCRSDATWSGCAQAEGLYRGQRGAEAESSPLVVVECGLRRPQVVPSRLMRLRGHLQHQMLDAEIPVGPQPLHNACDAPREMVTTGSSGLVVQHILGNPLDGAGDAHGEDRFSHASPLRPLVACIGDTCLELIERHGSGVPAIPKLRHTAPRPRAIATDPDGWVRLLQRPW